MKQYSTKWKALEALKKWKDAQSVVGKDAAEAVKDKRILLWVNLEAKLQDHRLSLEEVALDRLKALEGVETKKNLEDALAAFLLHQKAKNRSVTWRQSLRSTCSRFVNSMGLKRLCDSVNEKDVRDYLEGMGVAVRTKENTRLRLSSFFSYCVEEKHMSTPPLPKSYGDALKVDEAYKSIDYFTVPQVQDLLIELDSENSTTIKDMRCFVLLALFCGVRPQEFRKLVTYKGKEHEHILIWGDVDIKKGVLTISKHLSKVKKSRKVPIPQAATAWLLRWFDDGAFPAKNEPIVPDWHSEKYSRLKKASALPFTHDVLRHTYGTYRVALVGASKASTEMGNGAGVILKHYAEAVDESEAKAFFESNPTQVLTEKVVNFQKNG